MYPVCNETNPLNKKKHHSLRLISFPLRKVHVKYSNQLDTKIQNSKFVSLIFNLIIREILLHFYCTLIVQCLNSFWYCACNT